MKLTGFPNRYTHPCFTISQCWHIWEIHSPRLAHDIHISPGIFVGKRQVSHVQGVK